MTKRPAFMSREHVDIMNALLADAHDVHAACSTLDRSYVLHYDLTGGPQGDKVHWTMIFSPDGVRFGLDEPLRADLVIAGPYAEVVAASRAAREGREPSAQLPMTGDTAVLEVIGPAFAAARAAARVDVDFG
jgi:hypothetical protein